MPALPATPLPARLCAYCASFCSPAPTWCGPSVHLGPCAGPALFPSLTCSVSVSAPPVLCFGQSSCFYLSPSLLLSSALPPLPVLFPCSLEGLRVPNLCPKPCSPPGAQCQSYSSSERRSGWLSPKERPVETREGCPAVLLPSAQ